MKSIAHNLQEQWNTLCQVELATARQNASRRDVQRVAFNKLHENWKIFKDHYLKPNVKDVWSAEDADQDGLPYAAEQTQRPRENFYYRFEDNSVLGIIDENPETLEAAILTISPTLEQRKAFDKLTKIFVYVIKALVVCSLIVCAYALIDFF